MSNNRRYALIVAVAAGVTAVLPGTHSWIVFGARPILVFLALLALAPWRDR